MQHDMQFALTDFKILRVDFKVNVTFKWKDEFEINTQISLDHHQVKSDKILVVGVSVRTEPETETPYSFEVQGAGLFKFVNGFPAEKHLESLATINCPAIIFPYIRETIADLTRRAGFPPFHLAPVNFIELAKQRQDQKAKNE